MGAHCFGPNFWRQQDRVTAGMIPHQTILSCPGCVPAQSDWVGGYFSGLGQGSSLAASISENNLSTGVVTLACQHKAGTTLFSSTRQGAVRFEKVLGILHHALSTIGNLLFYQRDIVASCERKGLIQLLYRTNSGSKRTVSHVLLRDLSS